MENEELFAAYDTPDKQKYYSAEGESKAEYYSRFYVPLTVERIEPKGDLALISFKLDRELPAVKISEKKSSGG